MRKITLIIGGIRSGKSFFAEQRAAMYANSETEKPVYIATTVCSSCDGEMAVRIAAHQKRRGETFETIESPYDITGALSRLKNRTVLVDCLTLNLSNRLMATEEYLDLEELIESDEEYLEDIHRIIETNSLNVIFVSNEVGTSPIEMEKLGRFFQDLQGRWNCSVAAYADEVYMLRAGIPQQIKKKSCFPFKISAPSYLLPTGYIENVTYALDKVDDVQLLAFDSQVDDPLFKAETVSTLHFLAKESDLTYSVHMPVKPNVFDNLQERVESSLFIIEKLNSLNISSFSFHYDLPGDSLWKKMDEQEIAGVDETYISFFKQIREKFPDIDISLENTATPLFALDRVVKECGLSYCIDIGHLGVQGWGLSEIRSRLDRASVIHLHGWREIDGDRKDHLPIEIDAEIFHLLESYRGILTIENYHKIPFEKSLNLLKNYF